MWLVTTLIAATAATVAWRLLPSSKYKFDTLAMLLWGLGIMILIDHILGYEGGAFLEMETNGLVTNGVLLGLLMLVPVIAIWLVYVTFIVCKKDAVEG